MTGWENVLAKRRGGDAQGPVLLSRNQPCLPVVSVSGSRAHVAPGRALGRPPLVSLQAPRQVLPVLHTVQGGGAGRRDRVRHGLREYRGRGGQTPGDRQDEDRNIECLQEDFVIWKNMGHCADLQAQRRRGQGLCPQRGPAGRAESGHPGVPALLPASRLLGEPTLSQRAGAWVLGPGTGTGAAGVAVARWYV